MATTIDLGSVRLTPILKDGYLESLGSVAVNGQALRHPHCRFLPWFDTYQGDIFKRFRFVGIDRDGDRVTIRTTAISDPDAIFQERRDCSGDLCLRQQSWDEPALEVDFRIHLRPAEATFDGHRFTGFTWWFEIRGETVAVHRLADRQTWELGGSLDDVNLVCRNLFDKPRQRVTTDTGYSTVGLDNWSGLLPGNFWARWSLLPAFDMQYGEAGVLLGWFDQVSCIRTVIESQSGEAWIRYVDLHCFASSPNLVTNPKTMLHCADRLDDVDALNLWTRVYDQEHQKACRQFGIRDEAPPCLTQSINVWRDFHFDTTYEEAVDIASEFGMDYVFIDPVWENMETYARTLKQLVGDEQIAQTVLGKSFDQNMCCTLDFEVSRVAGGEGRLKALCDRAAGKGIKIISWMATHYTPRTQLARQKELGHGAGGIFACKESGRHPDTGYTGECWTLNLNAPIYEKIREQVLGVCQRTGLAGYLWDSYSNLGWWQVDYSDGSMRPQFDKMGELYAELVNAGLYIQPEAIVSFSNHSCCGLHGGNVYAGDLLGYSYNTVIGLQYRGADSEWGGDPVGAILRGKQPIDHLFQCFAHKRIPTMHLYAVPRDEWDKDAVVALKSLFAAYIKCRDRMRRRTVLKDNLGVLWDDGDKQVLWAFREQPAPAGNWHEALTDEPANTLRANQVYVAG